MRLLLLALLVGCGGHAQHDSATHNHGEEPGPHAHKGHESHKGHSGHYQHSFENAEAWAKRFDDPGRDAWQKPEHVVALMAVEPGMTVADLGAGTGYFLPYLSKAVGPSGGVLGLDVESDMVTYMKKRAETEGLENVTARRVPFDDPGLSSASVDRILIVNTWHHIAARAEYSKKLLAALRPGGAIYVVDYTKEAPHGPPAKHRLPAGVVAEELSSAGLRTEIADTNELPYQYVVIARP